MTDLAKRWLASPHWGGWRVGMVDAEGWIIIDMGDGVLGWWCPGGDRAVRYVPADEKGEPPDLDHPGTRAFLLEDVRRAWGGKFDYRIPHVIIAHDSHGVCRLQVFCSDSPGFGQFVIYADTEAEALIAALEAAP